jgi:hypothetical protein
MPIRQSEHGSLTITGAGIGLYRLLALKLGVEFENEHPGMQLNRGRSCTAIAKAELGLKRSTPRPVVIAKLAELIEVQALVVKAENEVPE